LFRRAIPRIICCAKKRAAVHKKCAINARGFLLSRVLIADDHAVVRAGYRQFLEADGSISEVGEAASGNETLDQLRRKDWNLLLMDIGMPDRSGLDILRHVISGFPDVRVLIMSGLPEEQYARNVLRAGASGYLSKGGSPEEMLKAVHLVLSGRRYVSAALAEAMAGDLKSKRDSNKPLHAELSAREFQIFCKLAAGDGVGEIAQELSLSVKTVSTYRTRILEKMNFKSNADITAYALRNGIIQ
jgi:two-component system invasion response regulator UvrY